MIVRVSVAVGDPARDLVEVSRAIELPASTERAVLVRSIEAHVRAATACLAERLHEMEPTREEDFVLLADHLEDV